MYIYGCTVSDGFKKQFLSKIFIRRFYDFYMIFYDSNVKTKFDFLTKTTF